MFRTRLSRFLRKHRFNSASNGARGTAVRLTNNTATPARARPRVNRSVNRANGSKLGSRSNNCEWKVMSPFSP